MKKNLLSDLPSARYKELHEAGFIGLPVEFHVKHCPFCGSKAEIERPGTARQSMIIACTNCGCRMESGDVVGLTPEQSWSWNRRAANYKQGNKKP